MSNSHTSDPVLRAMAMLRFGPMFQLPSAVKVGPFSFQGTLPNAPATTPIDLKNAASIEDSNLGQIASGSNPSITLIVTAINCLVNEQAAGLTASAFFDFQKTLELKHEASGVVRYLNLSQYMSRDYGHPTSVAAASQFGGQSNGGGPRLLSVPLIVDMQHDQTFQIAPKTAVAAGATMDIGLQLWGVAFSNTLDITISDCPDNSAAIKIGEQGAIVAGLASSAVNPDAYR